MLIFGGSSVADRLPCRSLSAFWVDEGSIRKVQAWEGLGANCPTKTLQKEIVSLTQTRRRKCKRMWHRERTCAAPSHRERAEKGELDWWGGRVSKLGATFCPKFPQTRSEQVLLPKELESQGIQILQMQPPTDLAHLFSAI